MNINLKKVLKLHPQIESNTLIYPLSLPAVNATCDFFLALTTDPTKNVNIIPVHKQILKDNSKFFEFMLEKNKDVLFKKYSRFPSTRRSQKNAMIEFVDENEMNIMSNGLAKLLRVVYQNKVEGLIGYEVSDLIDVYDAADRYQFTEMLEIIVEILPAKIKKEICDDESNFFQKFWGR